MSSLLKKQSMKVNNKNIYILSVFFIKKQSMKVKWKFKC